MPRTLPPLPWLRSFEAAARLASFVAAAEELALTPAAVGQHIRQLEEWIGAPVFVRQPGGLALTVKGAALLPPVAQSLDQLQKGLMEALGDGQRQTVVLRMPISFAVLWMAPRLPDFQALHPEIAIRLTTDVWQPTSDIIGSDGVGADLEIRHGLGRWPDGQAQRLTRDRLTPAFAPSFSDRLTGDDIPWDSLPPPLSVIGYGAGWAHWQGAHSKPPTSPGPLVVDSELVAASLAEAGHATCLARLPLYQSLLDRHRLIAPFPTVTVEDGFFLMRAPGKLLSEAASVVEGWLVDSLRKGADA